MADTQLFPKFLPKETKFIAGENPSPTKLSGTFSQLETAFSMLESFLGNGTDYHVTDSGNPIGTNTNRKMLFNISSAIGRTDKLYKPINMIPTLSFINNLWGGDATTYDTDSSDLVFVSGLNVGVPVFAGVGYEVGIYYRGQGAVTNLDGAGSVTPLANVTEWTWARLPVTANIQFIKVYRNMNAPGTEFRINSLYVVNKNLYNGVYNKAYCMSLENDSYWILKQPCQYANPNAEQKCEQKTCNYCIGQRYEMRPGNIAYGQPVCYSVAGSGAAQGAHWLNNSVPQTLTYTPETSGVRSQYLTVQSPLLTVYNQYAVKLAPYHMHNEIEDAQIPSNACVIYDGKNSSNPIKYLTNLFSAGGVDGDIRSDIFYIKDTNEVSTGASDPRRYLILGGNYGILDLIFDLLAVTNLPVPIDASDHVAVYSA